jgi:hypothetical protein
MPSLVLKPSRLGRPYVCCRRPTFFVLYFSGGLSFEVRDVDGWE